MEKYVNHDRLKVKRNIVLEVTLSQAIPLAHYERNPFIACW